MTSPYDTMTTPVDATITPEPTRDELSIQINTLQREVERLTNNNTYLNNETSELRQKIANVKGHIEDIYSMNGEISDEVKEIAELLGIAMTKTVNVSVTVTFSGTATVPLDYDVDDLEGELSFSVDEGYSDIEWDLDEDGQDWDVQEDY